MIRIALVNDYEIVVHGVATMLRSYADTVDVVELDTADDVEHGVDIALYDTFAHPTGDHDEIERLIDNPRIGHLAVYSWILDEALVRRAFEAGVSGYLSKALPAGRLVEALEAIKRGVQVRPDQPHNRKAPVVGGDWPGREEGLTAREAEILALITQGLTNDDIAKQTYLSLNSVKTYIRSCYRRIGVSSRAQAVRWGFEHGFRPSRRPGS